MLNWAISQADGTPVDIRQLHASLIWRPASGYRTATGKSKWRVVKEYRSPLTGPKGESHLIEARGRDGRVRLFDSYSAANDVADELRAADNATLPRYILKGEHGTSNLPDGCTAYDILSPMGQVAFRIVTDRAGAEHAMRGLGLELVSASRFAAIRNRGDTL
jgi:hypothetical protein